VLSSIFSMRVFSSSHIAVGKDVLLDGRFALFRKRERWLAPPQWIFHLEAN